jgi:hypothetical protein
MNTLKMQVQALAQPGKIQIELYPDGCVKADELALDFDNCFQVFKGKEFGRITNEQKKSLEILDSELAAMSGEENKELWTEEALLQNPRWENIRELSKKVLKEFNWKDGKPW